MALCVAVIGGKGFVGAALYRHLSGCEGFHVSVLARPDFDLTKPETYTAIGEDVDVLVHAAGAIGSAAPEQEFWDANVIATYHLVSHLNLREKPPRLVYLSTGAVGGERDGCIDAESAPAPKGPYALSKYLAEEVVRKSYRGEYCIPRLYFPYGPGQSADRLIPGLIGKVRRGEAIFLNNEGRPNLSLVYIDDLVRCLEALIRNSASGIINVAGDTRVSIADLVSVIEAVTGRGAVKVSTGRSVLDFCAEDCIGGQQVSLRHGIEALCESMGVKHDKDISQ